MAYCIRTVSLTVFTRCKVVHESSTVQFVTNLGRGLSSFLGPVKVIGVCNCEEAIVMCESMVSACINSG